MINNRNSNVNLIIQHICLAILISLFTSACQSIVPATSPLQLEFTPSPAITITASSIEGEWFRLDYPDNWRVITNVASEPLHLILVSPDDLLIIHVEDARNGCRTQETATNPDEILWDACVGEADAQIYIWGEQDSSVQTRYQPFFDFVRESIIIF